MSRAHTHLAEWGAEAAGSMLLILGGVSAVCLDFGKNSWVAAHVPSPSTRLLITGVLFAGTGSLVAVSPLGRLSGAHLNPVVTLAFRITGHVRPDDLAGYVTAQLGGALCGAALVRLIWGSVAVSVRVGMTRPSPSTPTVAAVAIEALMTAILLATILGFLSRHELMRWTPLAVWIVVALMVWRGAPYTGTSLNPARSLGPAAVFGDLSDYWVYVAGPVAGAATVALAVRFLELRPLTAKLFHDERYPSTMRSRMPVARSSTRSCRPPPC